MEPSHGRSGKQHQHSASRSTDCAWKNPSVRMGIPWPGQNARGVNRAKGTVLGGRPPRTYCKLYPTRLCRVYLQRAKQPLAAWVVFFWISNVPEIDRNVVPRDRLGRGGLLFRLMGASELGAICEAKRFVCKDFRISIRMTVKIGFRHRAKNCWREPLKPEANLELWYLIDSWSSLSLLNLEYWTLNLTPHTHLYMYIYIYI